MHRLWQLFVELIFARARETLAAQVQTSLLLTSAECGAAVELKARELEALGLHEQAAELRRQARALAPAALPALLAPAADTPAAPERPALAPASEPARRNGRPTKSPVPERSDP